MPKGHQTLKNWKWLFKPCFTPWTNYADAKTFFNVLPLHTYGNIVTYCCCCGNENVSKHIHQLTLSVFFNLVVKTMSAIAYSLPVASVSIAQTLQTAKLTQQRVIYHNMDSTSKLFKIKCIYLTYSYRIQLKPKVVCPRLTKIDKIGIVKSRNKIIFTSSTRFLFTTISLLTKPQIINYSAVSCFA